MWCLKKLLAMVFWSLISPSSGCCCLPLASESYLRRYLVGQDGSLGGSILKQSILSYPLPCTSWLSWAGFLIHWSRFLVNRLRFCIFSFTFSSASYSYCFLHFIRSFWLLSALVALFSCSSSLSEILFTITNVNIIRTTAPSHRWGFEPRPPRLAHQDYSIYTTNRLAYFPLEETFIDFAFR